jgi:hypothetical protein
MGAGAQGAGADVLVLKVLRVLALGGLLLPMAFGGCGRQEEPPIRLNGAWLVVENQSKIEWRDVSVTVNAYYKGVAPRVAPGGRLEAPLNGFVTGFGQRFNAARETVTHVAVRATDAAGTPVALDWDARTGPPIEDGNRGR